MGRAHDFSQRRQLAFVETPAIRGFQGIEIGARCCECNHVEGPFVEFNFQGVRTLTRPFSPISQLVQPQLPLHTFELLTDGTGNELITLCGVFHEPGR